MPDPFIDSLDRRLDTIARHPFRAKFRLRGRDRATAQLHATATCCRTCLLRWHQIPKGRELPPEDRPTWWT